MCSFVLSHIWLSETPRTVAHQAPLSMEFSRQEYWSGLPFPSGFNPWVGKIHRRRERLPPPVFWPGEFHGQSQTQLNNFHFSGARQFAVNKGIRIYTESVYVCVWSNTDVMPAVISVKVNNKKR